MNRINTLQEIKDIILNRDNYIITTHLNPDGDGLGAGLALYLSLKKIGKNVIFMVEDPIPDNLKFLSKIDEIVGFSETIIDDKHIILSLDAGDLGRIGKIGDYSKKNILINIDHHASNTLFGDYNYVDKNIASTSEIIFELIELLEIKFDKEICDGIYTGIVNDTGNFKHSNVTVKTFQKAGKLIENGVSNSEIISNFYDNKSFQSLKILGVALNKAIFDKESKLIYTVISRKDLDENNSNKFHTDGIVENLIYLNEAKVALFIREDKEGIYKGSMRTRGEEVDLTVVASMFAGGGHKKAAGFTSNLTPSEIINLVKEKIKG